MVKKASLQKKQALVYKPDNGASQTDPESRTAINGSWLSISRKNTQLTYRYGHTMMTRNSPETVKGLKCMQKDNMEKPIDACIKDNGETYEIQPEKEGTTLDTKKVQKVIRAAVSAGDTTVNLEKKDCYKKPSVYKDDKTLKKDCDQMNKLTSCVITYDFSDRSEQLDRNTIKDWLTKDEKGRLYN